MTEREAPPGWGFDHRQDDPYEDDGWFGREQVDAPTPQFAEPAPPVAEPAAFAEPAPAEPVHEVRPHSQPAEYVPAQRYEPTREAPRAAAPATRRPVSPTVSTWTVNGQLRASSNSTLTFRSPPPPWYRTRPAKIALIAVATAAVAVPIVLLAFRGDSATSPEQSTSVAPKPSTSAQPVPSNAPPAPINAPPPLPPPPPPPPPPPAEDTGSAPTYNQPDWTRPAPPPEKPQVDVTRAPISVAPVPRRPPEGHVGESNKPGCGGWC